MADVTFQTRRTAPTSPPAAPPTPRRRHAAQTPAAYSAAHHAAPRYASPPARLALRVTRSAVCRLRSAAITPAPCRRPSSTSAMPPCDDAAATDTPLSAPAAAAELPRTARFRDFAAAASATRLISPWRLARGIRERTLYARSEDAAAAQRRTARVYYAAALSAPLIRRCRHAFHLMPLLILPLMPDAP